MKLSKKAAALAAAYAAAAVLTACGFAIKAGAAEAAAKRSVAVDYSRAFSELADSLDSMETALQKSVYASSAPMVSSVCAEIYAKSAAAQTALSALPYSDAELGHTAAFISKAGDYAFALSRSAAAGVTFTDEDRQNLIFLSDSAARLAGNLDELQARLLAGDISVGELEQAQDELAEAEDSAAGTGFSGSLRTMETEFPELPSLIYDGPFSSSVDRMEPRLLEGRAGISEQDAVDAAAEFTGIDASGLVMSYLRQDRIPVYVVTGESRGGEVTCEVTKAGGAILYFGDTRAVQTSVMSGGEGAKLAENFLVRRGFGSMRRTYTTEENNRITVNFAWTQDGVICYPDLVKVTVALDTGAVVSFEDRGYIMSHCGRDIPAVKVSAESAQSKLSPVLNVMSHELAVIPTGGKNEVFCHEFKCGDDKGRHCLVYVNAVTGNEEKILILLEDESGTLTI